MVVLLLEALLYNKGHGSRNNDWKPLFFIGVMAEVLMQEAVLHSSG